MIAARPCTCSFSVLSFAVLSASFCWLSARSFWGWSRRDWVSASCLLATASLSALRERVIASSMAPGLVAGVVVVGAVGPGGAVGAGAPGAGAGAVVGGGVVVVVGSVVDG